MSTPFFSFMSLQIDNASLSTAEMLLCLVRPYHVHLYQQKVYL